MNKSEYILKLKTLRPFIENTFENIYYRYYEGDCKPKDLRDIEDKLISLIESELLSKVENG